MIPEILISDGNFELDKTGILSLLIVPEEILFAFIEVIFDPIPEN